MDVFHVFLQFKTAVTILYPLHNEVVGGGGGGGGGYIGFHSVRPSVRPHGMSAL